MNKRLRKKKLKSNNKKIDIEVSNIKCLEENHNYLVTFKEYETNRSYQIQIVKYMPSLKYITSMRSDCAKKTLLKGVIDLNKNDLCLYIPKYRIVAKDALLCLGHCVSSKVKTNRL